jgi:hypothetical protein
MAEVLAPTRQAITQKFERGFEGMTENPVALDELLNATRHISFSVGYFEPVKGWLPVISSIRAVMATPSAIKRAPA